MSAINFMYHFAQRKWNKRLSGGLTVWVETFSVEIDVEAVRAQRASTGLQTSHIVVGLYQTIPEVSDQSRFCEVLTTLSLQGRQIGSLAIQKRISGTERKGGFNATSSLMVKDFLSTNAATYPSGQIIDVDDPPFTISYTFSGIRINSKDIFLAVLDALATAAPFPTNTPFRSLDAISASGDCVISIAVDSSQSQLSYSYVTKALRELITSVMVVLRKFEEVTFQLNWRAEKMVEGSIRLADHRSTT